MNFKELTKGINDHLTTYEYKSTEPQDVRSEMYYAIKSLYPSCTALTNTNTEISIKIDEITCSFKVSTKGTKGFVKVSNTKNKEIKSFGKVKLFRAEYKGYYLKRSWSIDRDIFLNDKKFKLVRSERTTYTRDYDFNFNLKETDDIDTLMTKYLNELDYDKIRTDIINDMMQPLIGVMFNMCDEMERTTNADKYKPIPGDMFGFVPAPDLSIVTFTKNMFIEKLQDEVIDLIPESFSWNSDMDVLIKNIVTTLFEYEIHKEIKSIKRLLI